MTEKNKKEKSYTILIGEDDQFLHRALADKLKRAGFKTVSAKNGEEVMKELESEKPDLVLLDLMMPVKNGFEALSEIRAKEETKSTPVIVLSNLGQESDVDKAVGMGANDYFIKSDIQIGTIIEKVKEHIESGNK